MNVNILNRVFTLYSCHKYGLSSVILPKLNGLYYSTTSNNDKSAFPKKLQTDKKRIFSPKITLISPDDSIVVSSLEEAQKLSRRRDLKLVKIIDFDTKTKRPVYRLMSGADYHTEELKKRAERQAARKDDSIIKGEKLLTISGKISEHDLSSRIKNVFKWLQKQYEVKVVLHGDGSNMENAEKVYAKLESEISDTGRILQKRVKGSDIKFQIQPILKKKQPIPNNEPPSRNLHTEGRSL